MTAVDVRRELLRGTAGHRHGVVEPAELLRTVEADLEGIHHAAVATTAPDGHSRVAGGCGRDPGVAIDAAIAEALERHAALVHEAPPAPAAIPVLGLDDFSLFDAEQRRHPAFPHRELFARPPRLVGVEHLGDGRAMAAPEALVLFRGGPEGGLATSSGLAAGPSVVAATLRAVEELVERDALMVTWLHGIAGRRVALDEERIEPVRRRGGHVALFDITPAYSPHPVALVAGGVPLRGRMRFAIGAACRWSWGAAVEKASLEWAQGLMYAGYRLRTGLPELRRTVDISSFEDHAVWYTLHPDDWERLPLHGDTRVHMPPPDATAGTRRHRLRRLVAHLSAAGVDLLGRELTTVETRHAGVSVVRVLSPQLTPIHAHERWPFLGGRTRDVGWRYPHHPQPRIRFPSRFPHPLG